MAIMVIILILIAFFTGIQHELQDEEPRRAVIAIEMLLTGDYLQPKIFGEPYYNKPPFFNWLIALAYNLTGKFDEWVVRLPSLLFLLLTAVVNYLFLKRHLAKEVALLSSFFLLTSADILFYGSFHSGEIDLSLTLPVYFQVISIFIFYEKRRFLLLFMTSYFFAAIVFLFKHFAAFVFQGLAILSLVVYSKNWKLLFTWQHVAGLITFVGVTGSYFFIYSLEHPIDMYLANLFFETSLKSSAKNWQHGLAHVLIYPLNLIKLLLPWSLLYYFLFRKNGLSIIKAQPLIYFSFIFSSVVIIFHWFLPETRNRYLYPVFIFTIMPLAYFFNHFLKHKIKWALMFMMLLVVARIFFNFLYLHQKPFKYQTQFTEVVDIANGEQVYFCSWPYIYEAGLKINKQSIFNYEIETGPPVPPHIPYYYSKTSKKILYFRPEPQQGNYYLAPVDFIQDRKIVVYSTLEVDWIKNGLLFFKLTPSDDSIEE